MYQSKKLFIVALTIMLGACSTAPKKPIAFNAGAVSGSENRVAIQLKEIPETDTTFPGAGCLLCIGVARAAHTDLSTQVQSLVPEELNTLPDRLADALRSNGAQVTVLDHPIDIDSLTNNSQKGDDQSTTEKDFRPLIEELEADKLLVVDIRSQGVLRPYSSYFPADVPKAFVSGVAYMVDLRNNAYIWYSPVNITRSADGEWNEPPSFPGLTNAYYQVLAETSDSLVRELSRNTNHSSSADISSETSAQVMQ